MLFNPSNVWGWYQRQSKWIKWALIIFVVIAVIIAFIFTFLSGNGSGAGIDPVKTAKDGSEKFFQRRWNKAKKQDAAAAERIKREEAERDELKEGRKDAIKENEDTHRAVDAADSIDAVDDIISSRR